MRIPFGIIGLLCILNFILVSPSYLFHSNKLPYPAAFLGLIHSFLSPLILSVYIVIFFLIPLHYYVKIPFSHFKGTFVWVVYGMVPEFLSKVLFTIIHQITSPIQVEGFSGLFVWTGFPILYFFFGIWFLLWSARIWYAGLTAAETLSEK
jgi:hypothetical protein